MNASDFVFGVSLDSIARLSALPRPASQPAKLTSASAVVMATRNACKNGAEFITSHCSDEL